MRSFLARCVLLVLLSVVGTFGSPWVFAEGSVSGSQAATFNWVGRFTPAPAAAICQEIIDWYAAGGSNVSGVTTSAVVVDAQTAYCHEVYSPTYSQDRSIDYVGVSPVCPSNSTAVAGSSCSCNSGFVPGPGGTCAPASNVCPSVAAGAGGTYYSSQAGAGLSMCSGNCTLTSGLSGSDSSGTYFSGPFSWSGGTCSGATSPASQQLLPGNCPGTVNGVAVPGGVPCGTTTSSSSSSSSPGPSSSGPAAPDASNGSSTSSTTQCSGGNCTTTTTTSTTTGVGSAGGGTTVTGTSSTTQSQPSFCQANPADPQCTAEKSSFGGDCASDFSCKGDAVACATAKIEYESTCVFNAAPSAATAAKYAALTAQDGQVANGAGSSSLGVGSVLPAPPPAACAVQDIVIPIGGGFLATVLTLPVGTYLCPNLALIRTVIVGFGSLMFILIVFVRN